MISIKYKKVTNIINNNITNYVSSVLVKYLKDNDVKKQ